MKKLQMYSVWVLVLLTAAVVIALSVRELIDNSEGLWLKNSFQESHAALKQALAANPTNAEKAEIYWRMSRNLYDMAEGMPREAKQPRLANYIQIQDLCKKCKELAPAMPECYLFLATGIGREGTQKGVLNMLPRIKEVESLYLKVIELKPTYRSTHGEANTLGDAYYALGIFYRLVPDWSVIQLLYKTKGDKKKSLDMLRKAVAIEPERLEYAKELGVVLVCYGQTTNNQASIDEGKKVLQKVLTMTEYKPTDKIDKDHAKMILANPKTACGYSRDAQQDVSRESFNKKSP